MNLMRYILSESLTEGAKFVNSLQTCFLVLDGKGHKLKVLITPMSNSLLKPISRSLEHMRSQIISVLNSAAPFCCESHSNAFRVGSCS